VREGGLRPIRIGLARGSRASRGRRVSRSRGNVDAALRPGQIVCAARALLPSLRADGRAEHAAIGNATWRAAPVRVVAVNAFTAPRRRAIRQWNRRCFGGEKALSLDLQCRLARRGAAHNTDGMPRLLGRGSGAWRRLGFHLTEHQSCAASCQYASFFICCRNTPICADTQMFCSPLPVRRHLDIEQRCVLLRTEDVRIAGTSARP